MSALRLVAPCCLAVAISLAPSLSAQEVVLDRVVVRFTAPEIGGPATPRFIFERELGFEARLEALSDPHHDPEAESSFKLRHVRAALERHIAETLLESLPIEPEPTEAQMRLRIEAARRALYQRVGGPEHVEAAARSEGLEGGEVERILRREARASLYLDQMVAPMLDPSEAELKNVHRTLRTPFSKRPYEKVRGALRRWYVSARLGEALASYYEGARARLDVTVLQ